MSLCHYKRCLRISPQQDQAAGRGVTVSWLRLYICQGKQSTLWYMTTWTVTTFCQTMRRGRTTNYFHVTVLTTSGLGLCVLKRRRNMMDYQSMKENSLSSLWTPHQNWKWKCFLLEVCKSPNVDWLYNQMWRVLQSLDWLTDWLPHKQVQFTNILLLERVISHVTRSCLYKHLL